MTNEDSNAENTFIPAPQMDAELQQELDDALGDMSLDDILAAETPKAAPAAEGEGDSGLKIGKVIAIQGDDIFCDMGGKREGVLPVSQFVDEPVPAVGDQIKVKIIGLVPGEGLLQLARKGTIQEASWGDLEVDQIVEGRVTALNTGGLELTVDGIRAFMPISQIELHRVEDLSPYVNEKLRCSIIEVKDNGIVVGRRSLLEAEMAKSREETLEQLTEGAIVEGVVRSIMAYGAFVDIGGVDGLLHVSDMSYARVDDPNSIVKTGQEVKVVVLKVDKEAKRISLGLKQIAPDPWEAAATKWTEGETVTGRVVRLADFGAFVELEPGVDGLIPMGELSFQRVKQASDVVKVGDVIRIRIMRIELDRKRISLSLKQVGDDPWIGAAARWPADSEVEGVVTRIADFGAFVSLTAGVEGLIHISEMSSEHVRSVGDVVKEGQTVKSKVLSVDEDARRISLSIKALTEASGDYYIPDPAEHPATPVPERTKPLKGGLEFPGGGWGSLGSL